MKFSEYLTFLAEDLMGQKQKRLEFIVKTYEHNWRDAPIEGYVDIKQFVEKIGEIDPTKNGAYMQWIAKLIIKNRHENRPEDLTRLKKDLIAFEENKSKIHNKDINSYKSFSDLYSAIEPFTVKRPKTAEEKRATRMDAKTVKTKEGIIDVYSGEHGWIKIPTTKAASQYLGQMTRWCTSAKGQNAFDSYNKRDRLFVIYDKESKQRFQMHIESGQFSDATDKMKGMKAVPEWARKPIVDWYKHNNTNKLSLKHVMTLSDFGDKNIAKGTDHEELLDLMKKYGMT